MQKKWMAIVAMGLMLASCSRADRPAQENAPSADAHAPEAAVPQDASDAVIVSSDAVRLTLSDYEQCVAVHAFEGQLYSKRALANPRFQHDEIQRCLQMKLMADAIDQSGAEFQASDKQAALRAALVRHNAQSEPELASKIGVKEAELGRIVELSLLMPTLQRVLLSTLSDSIARRMFETDFRRYTVEVADFENTPSPEDVDAWLKTHEEVFSAYIGVHQEVMMAPPHAKFVRMAYGYANASEGLDAARLRASELRKTAIRGLDEALGQCESDAACEVLNTRDALYDVERTDELSWAFRMPVGGVSEVIHAQGSEEVWVLQEVVPPQKRNIKDDKDRQYIGAAVMHAVEPSSRLMAVLKPALEAEDADLKSVTEANGGRYRLFKEMTHIELSDKAVMESARVLKALSELHEGETLLYSNPIIDGGRVYVFRVMEISVPKEGAFEAQKEAWQTRKVGDKSYSLVVSWLENAMPNMVSLNIKPVQEKYGVLQPNGMIR